MACDSDPIRDVTTAITSDPRAPRRVLYELLDWGGWELGRVSYLSLN